MMIKLSILFSPFICSSPICSFNEVATNDTLFHVHMVLCGLIFTFFSLNKYRYKVKVKLSYTFSTETRGDQQTRATVERVVHVLACVETGV